MTGMSDRLPTERVHAYESLQIQWNKETCKPLLTSLLLFFSIKADREEQNSQKKRRAALGFPTKAGWENPSEVVTLYQ